ncbi:hypothetical protein [Egicoccus halophilus]|uniref:Uncharacterized protein n=1 Tax=Egicoccus halophilus TaxID=1670830 RepID=A0A8J3A6M1_9ACTN|nr:hypothetical protein [Egicoccus halophilus]GGI04797.1 hypothetical protein GCM10011354_10890 [Egicoccus halophilus]
MSEHPQPTDEEHDGQPAPETQPDDYTAQPGEDSGGPAPDHDDR